jgi:methylmalonyl-CoA/ethylmalonyl-CoA epimerase
MYISHVDHIGIAVRSIEESRKFYEDILMVGKCKIEEIPDQKVRTAIFHVGTMKIELLEPTDPESPVAKFIEKKGPGFHHIAYFVDNVNESLSLAKSRGVELIDKESRIGAEGYNIGFLHPKSTEGILTELCSNRKVL